MSIKALVYSIVFFLSVISVNAQEVLINLSSYPISKTDSKTKISSRKGMLTLPFFDDFARNTTFPTTDLWEESSVTSNQNYAINPPTIGVATFDAINRKGELYESLSTTESPADTLTSLSIDLSYTPNDSIYISFSIQPQGLGYQPSDRDSLVLEFWDNSQSEWVRVWSASANFSSQNLLQKFHLTDQTTTVDSDSLRYKFFNVIFGISDPRFLTSNFKFRFINYASIASNQVIPGLLCNSDHWNLDMVYLNSNRTFDDTLYNDVSFIEPIGNLMSNFTAIPWKHLSNASSEFTDPREFKIKYHNLGPLTWNISRRFRIVDESGSQTEYQFSGGAEDIDPFSEVDYTRLFDYNFTSAWEDSAKLWLQSYLVTDFSATTEYLRYNDTISQTIVFDNYYALDDGSAEAGYGLYGEGTEDGMVACKFHCYKADSLKGALIYFNRTLSDANEKEFILTIWDDNNGKPGDIIYEKDFSVLFEDSLNKYTTYRIDPTYIPAGDFYIGWTQVTTDMLNVGFDRNNNNQSRIFYNITGEWVNTSYEGSLMIRPIFGSLHQIPTNVEPEHSETDFTIYPNPAKTEFYLALPNNFTPQTIQVINSSGMVVKNTYYSSSAINIENLPSGIYLVKLCSANGKCAIKKVVVIK